MGRLNVLIGEYAKNNPVRFHMPGHKGKIYNNLDYSLDVTELFFTDNLYNPDGELNLINNLEKRISKCFFKNIKVNSLISCSGATLCIQGAILALKQTKLSEKLYIICDRTSHISFINAISLLNITPLWLEPNENFEEKINYFAQNQDIKDIIGVFVTSPDYFGEMKNIESISKECKKYCLNLAVDNSHGSHLAFYNDGNLHPINCGAEISIDSVHKTLPVLTGAAILHANKNFGQKSVLKKSINMFATTSPSFLILQSIESMIDLLEERGFPEHEKLLNYINNFKKKAETIGFIFNSDKFYDPYRIILNCENLGEKLYYKLVDKNIFCEFFTKDSVIIIPSIANTPEDFEKLFGALNNFAKNNKIIYAEPKEIMYPPGFSNNINQPERR